MGAIGDLVVNLDMKANGFVAGTQRARGANNQLAGSVRASVPPVKLLADHVKLAGQEMDRTATKTARADKAFGGMSGRAKQNVSQMAFAIDDFANSSGNFANRMRGVNNNISTLVTSINPVAGIVTTLALASLPLLIRAFSKTGDAALSAEQKAKKLGDELERIGKLGKDEFDFERAGISQLESEMTNKRKEIAGLDDQIDDLKDRRSAALADARSEVERRFKSAPARASDDFAGRIRRKAEKAVEDSPEVQKLRELQAERATHLQEIERAELKLAELKQAEERQAAAERMADLKKEAAVREEKDRMAAENDAEARKKAAISLFRELERETDPFAAAGQKFAARQATIREAGLTPKSAAELEAKARESFNREVAAIRAKQSPDGKGGKGQTAADLAGLVAGSVDAARAIQKAQQGGEKNRVEKEIAKNTKQTAEAMTEFVRRKPAGNPLRIVGIDA